MKIARVFPTKTSMSPTDPLAFFGPPTLDAMAAEPEAVHISVTFSWDFQRADDLYYQWEMLGVPVEVGGPAFGDHMSESFTPGLYLREGMTITSRGCPKDCWFCDVGKCARGRVKCPGCGQSTPWFKAKHDAQMDWNGRFGIRTHGWGTVYGRMGTGVPEETGSGEPERC